jgi:hypothetical protein
MLRVPWKQRRGSPMVCDLFLYSFPFVRVAKTMEVYSQKEVGITRRSATG